MLYSDDLFFVDLDDQIDLCDFIYEDYSDYATFQGVEYVNYI